MTDAQNEPKQYNVLHQRVSVDIDLYHRALYGFTELTLALSAPVKAVRINTRHCMITDVTVDSQKAVHYIEDSATDIEMPRNSDITQHHLYKQKMESLLTTAPPVGELIIEIPKFRQEMSSITLRVDFSLTEPTTGFNFVGGKNSNLKKNFWHAYTTNTPIGIATSSWVPCIDGMWELCTWQFEISIPRSISQVNGDVENLQVEEDEEMVQEQDLVVVSAEQQATEVAHPKDPSKKIVSFDIMSPTAAQNVGFAVGPFTLIPLPDFKEEEARDIDDIDDDSAIPIQVYGFADRTVEIQNTCIFVNKVMDYYSKEFGSFPFPSLSFVFVSDAITQFSNSVGLIVCDDKLLYPPNVIEPIFSAPRHFSVAIATQWVGISILPKRWEDLWLIFGISGFMSLCFLKKLIGNNEYRFSIKKLSEEICSKDIGMPPLASPKLVFPLTDRDLEFLRLKSPIVLFILDRRMTKTDKSLGLSRAIPKIFLQSMSGDLSNSCLSTAHFIKVCERVGHNKLDVFFNQWVYGSGYPIFRVTQRFNKKRMFIEMGIRQVQTAEIAAMPPSDEDFVRNSQNDIGKFSEFPVQPIFTVCIFFLPLKANLLTFFIGSNDN